MDSSEQVISSLQRPVTTHNTGNPIDKHPCHAFRGIRTRNLKSQASAELRFKPHGHRERKTNNGETLNLRLCLRIINYFII